MRVPEMFSDHRINNFKVIKKCRDKFECLVYAVDQEQKTETEHASGFHSRETLYLNAFMLIYFLTFNIYKYAFPLFPFYSFDNDDMKSSKRHAVLLSLIFLLKCFSESFFIVILVVFFQRPNIIRLYF